MAAKPTILFVHGAWHCPDHCVNIMALLEKKGYECCCPLQPTYGSATLGLDADANYIKAETQKFIDAGKDVILVLHSYGGIVGTEAIDKSMSKASRKSNGLDGGVTYLLFMCAFMHAVGAAPGDTFGGALPPFVKIEPDGSCNMEDPKGRFYSDLGKEAQDHWLSLTKQHSSTAQLMPLTNAAYLYVPTAYLFTEMDVPLPIEFQEEMVAGIEKTVGISVRRFTCRSGHSAYLSVPDKVVEVICELAEEGHNDDDVLGKENV